MTEKTTDNFIKTPMSDAMFRKLIAPSVICIVLCMLCLCGTTFAWLSDATESGKNKITSGFFNVKVTSLKCDEETCEKIDENGFEYRTSAKEGSRAIFISLELAEGSSSNGYAVVEVFDSDGSVVKTHLVSNPDSSATFFSFTSPDSELTVRITPVFGPKPTE